MNTPTKEVRAGIPDLQENGLTVARIAFEAQAVNQPDDASFAGQDAIGRVREYRKAARIAVRRETASAKRRLLAILDLMAEARAEPDSIVREWSEKAIQEEVEDFVGFEKFSDEQEPASGGDPQARKQRQLRDEGYERCDKCFSRLMDETDFAREEAIRQAELERLKAREGAVR